ATIGPVGGSDADEFFHDLRISSSQFKATVAAVAEAENDHAVSCDALYDLKDIVGPLVESIGCVTHLGLSMAAGCDTDDLIFVFKLCNEGLKLVDVSEDPSVKQQKGFTFTVNFIVETGTVLQFEIMSSGRVISKWDLSKGT